MTKPGTPGPSIEAVGIAFRALREDSAMWPVLHPGGCEVGARVAERTGERS